MKLFFLFLLICSNLQAQDLDCITDQVRPSEEAINLAESLLAATGQAVLKAPCKSGELAPLSELKDFIESKKVGKSLPLAKINGVTFKNENPVLIQAFKDLTRSLNMEGDTYLPAKQKNFQLLYKINPTCETVQCAVEKIWGPEMGTQILYLKLLSGFNASEFAFDQSERFSPEELKDVILAVKDLPADYKGNRNQRMTLFTKGLRLPDQHEDVQAMSYIFFYDNWSAQKSGDRQSTVYHEIGHLIGANLKLDSSPEWQTAAGWMKKGSTFTTEPDHCMTSKYADQDPFEDFAETITQYRYSGELLKSRCPKKFEFMKTRVFKNVEYLAADSCSLIPQEKLDVVRSKLLDLTLTETSPITNKDVVESCQKKFTQFPATEEELLNCASEILLKRSSPQSLQTVLQEAGLPNTQTNREIILSHLDPKLLAPMTQVYVSLKSSELTASIDETLTKAIADSFPKEGMGHITMINDLRLWEPMKTCSSSIHDSDLTTYKECVGRLLTEKELILTEWTGGALPAFEAPEIFSGDVEGIKAKRAEALVKFFAKNPLTEEAITSFQATYLKSFNILFTKQVMETSAIPDWKKLSPEEYCSKSYDSIRDPYLSQFGFTKESGDAVFQQRCVSLQARTPERVVFTSEEWASLGK